MEKLIEAAKIAAVAIGYLAAVLAAGWIDSLCFPA